MPGHSCRCSWNFKGRQILLPWTSPCDCKGFVNNSWSSWVQKLYRLTCSLTSLLADSVGADFLFRPSQECTLLDRLSVNTDLKVLLENADPSHPQVVDSDSQQQTHAITSHMRSVLQSIQPINHTPQVKAAKHKHQLPSVLPASLAKQSENTASSDYRSAPTSGPEQHGVASRCQPTSLLPAPSIERKRDAQGRLRSESDLQATSGRDDIAPLSKQKTEQANDAGDLDVIDAEIQQGTVGPFKTAKAIMLEDMRKKGQTYRSQGASSSQESDRAPAAVQAPFKRLGLTKNGQKRPGTGAPFKPPYKAKNSEPEEGEVSPKALEMLAGPDGELPEALQKLEPAILELVCNEIVERGGHVQWDDIAGQDQAKCLVQELVVWPMLNPHLFKGARAPAKGLLLFGPPGTGKTLIGKAIASNIKATFFNISASSLTSKWIGQGEKMVRALFAVAGCMQPAVIFVDEIDSILSARKSEGEHEASRRLKTEMLVQMEGCDPNSADRRVLLVGATNRPEELDEAARRRMPKQLYIPLPCAAARRQMVDRQLGGGSGISAQLSEADLTKIVTRTEGYSGSDMRNLIQEACQGPVRNAMTKAAQLSTFMQLSEADLRPVVLKDFQMAAKAQRASVEPAEVVRCRLVQCRLYSASFLCESGLA
ncbi:hypothetical protein ABBQ32_006818 [Trebouxia sp. C0010 RCD-2024]